MSALEKAFADSQRSYFASKASVASATGEQIFASTSGGLPFAERRGTGNAQEQLRNFHSWVFACVHAIASRIAGQAVHVGRPKRIRPSKAATLVPEETHPLLSLLNDPNDLQIAWSLWYWTVASLELTGRALWLHVEDDEGGRDQLLPIPTPWIVSMTGALTFDSFLIRPPNSADEYEISADEAVYFYYPHPSGPRDWCSPLQAAAFAADADIEIQRSQAAAFRHGVFPHLALIVGKTPDGNASQFGGHRPRLSGAQRKQLVRSIQQLYAGAVKAHEPLILDGLIESVQKLSMGPAEMDWKDSGALVKARLTQCFGVSPLLLGETQDGNRAAALAAELHMAGTLNPKLRLIGDTITEWLAPRFAGGQQGLRVWFDPYVPDDAEMRLKYRSLMAQYGAVTKDELRAWGGEPPLPHGTGTFLIDGTATGGIEGAINRHVQQVAHSEAGEYLRVADSSRAARERQRERSNGKH